MFSTIIEQIRQLEDKRVAAQIDSDHTALDFLIHPDLVYLHSNGMSDSKSSYTERIRLKEQKYININRSCVNFITLSDAVIVHGRADVTVLVGENIIAALIAYCAIWERTSNGWLWRYWQATPLPCARNEP